MIEAKKEGSTLIGVEVQSAHYAQGLPANLPAWVRPLPFSYESTGIETHFTQGLDPQSGARNRAVKLDFHTLQAEALGYRWSSTGYRVCELDGPR